MSLPPSFFLGGGYRGAADGVGAGCDCVGGGGTEIGAGGGRGLAGALLVLIMMAEVLLKVGLVDTVLLMVVVLSVVKGMVELSLGLVEGTVPYHEDNLMFYHFFISFATVWLISV